MMVYNFLQFSLIPTGPGHKLRQCAKKESSKVDVISGWANSKRGDIWEMGPRHCEGGGGSRWG